MGRVVFTAGALPAIRPVNYVVDDDGAILMRTGARTRLAAAADGGIVAFEVDQFDNERLCGWSVMVTGALTTLRDPEAIAAARGRGLRTWVAEERDRFLRISPDLVTGRRIPPAID
jgi:nitroimidazol reductase NimA-like FMN-containing flavoprotein (pyridoxamine 5'-phosphate oxidase superfamily)